MTEEVTREEIAVATKAVMAIPCRNPSMMSLYQETVGTTLCRELVEKIVKVALAAAQSRPTKGADSSEEFSRAAVGQAMQTAWNEICSDTGCHPLDITRQGKKLFFDPGHWAALTATHLNAFRQGAPT